jgi:hypothetical protein
MQHLHFKRVRNQGTRRRQAAEIAPPNPHEQEARALGLDHLPSHAQRVCAHLHSI